MINYLFTNTFLSYFVQSFWRDEAFTYFLAKQNLVDIALLTVKDFNPPFYYFVIHFWIKLFGSSEISLRLFSLICFWGIIYVGFIFLKNIFKFSLKKSFFYLIVLLINPLLIYYAFEARMYSLFGLLASLSFYFFYQKKKLAYTVITVVGLYTHYFMVFVVLSQVLFIFLIKEKIWFKQIKSILFSIVGFIPWLIFLLLNKPIFAQSFWVQKPSFLYAFNLLSIVYTGHESETYSPETDIVKKIILILNLFLFFLIIIGSFKFFKYGKKTEKQIFFLLFIWGIIMPLSIGIISFIKPIYFPRYLIFTTFGQLILIIFILNKLSKKTLIFFLIPIIILTLIYNKNQIKFRKKSDLSKTIKEIKSIANHNDLLYVTNELDFFTAKYYFNENQVYIYQKSYDKIPDYVGKVLIPENKITFKLPIYPKKAFILNNDNTYEIQAMY